ncbi:MAG: sulfatase [Planctomycetota bacterium]
MVGGCGGGGADDGRIELGRPPVVFILLDALHAEHLSHLGNGRETTPHLDALAAEGVSFPTAFAPAPYTLATVSSILTGRLPDVHGLVDKGATLLPEEVTLAELLQRGGYRTFAAVGNLNGSSIFGCEQGFEHYTEVFRPGDGRSVDVEFEGDQYHYAKAVDYPPIVARWLADGAAEGDRPPFLYLHILEPHEPYSPPEAFRARFVDPGYDGPYRAGDSAALIQGRRGNLPFEDEDKEAVEALYDANLAHSDAVVGEILGMLDEAGILDEALIVVTSDHGEAFWQHGEQGHNTTLYDEMLRVPLIVRFPAGAKGVPAGARPAALVSPMDLLPSFSEWLDLPLPASDLDGTSLSAALRDAADPDRALILRSHHDPPWFGLRTAGTKTIVVPGAGGTPGRIEHYRLDADPAEARNARAEHGADAQSDYDALQRFAADTAHKRVSRGFPISEAEKAMLERLGYTDGD